MAQPGHRILVVNAKGGCGKTTLSTNLAAYYAHHYTTKLVDQDPQGSSLRWLQHRLDERPKVVGMRADDAGYRPNVTRTWLMQNPDFQRTVIDAPAGVSGRDLEQLVHEADTILIPVQPSPIDIAATADFIRDLLLDGKVRSLNVRLGVVANRVKANTKVYQALQRFLKTLGLPFVGALRDTQVYNRAAEEGLGIHELPLNLVKQDIAQWQPILHWLERRLRVETGVRPVQTAAPVAPPPLSSDDRIGVTGSR